MIKETLRKLLAKCLRTNPRLIALMVFMVLIGWANWLIINQKVILYLFYLPVVFAAWMLPRRDAISAACLAALMVVAFVFFVEKNFQSRYSEALLWAELAIWSGILILTAYMVATLRAWTREAMQNLDRAYKGVLAILSRFIQTVDADTENHCVRVAAWAIRIGKEMRLKQAQIEELRIAGLLHDVGKVDVSVEILRKTAVLSKDEQDQIQQHTSRGAALVKPVGGMLARIADAVEMHHEKYDGSGYIGLQAEEIPLIARILAVADAFDALLSDRSYRKGVSVFEAMDNIIVSTGSHFDPAIVVALKNIINREGEQALLESLNAFSPSEGGSITEAF